MELYKQSTKLRPLLFFETFINNIVLNKYQDMFYFPLNPSQENFKGQGLITYYKAEYEENEPYIPVKLYFKDSLEKLFKAEINKTSKLLIERRDELEYQNINTDIFITRQISRINKLKIICESITIQRLLVSEVINTIAANLEEIKGHLSETPKQALIIKRTNPFFEPIVKNSVLKKLYEVAVDYQILDDEVVYENSFIEIFNSNKPQLLKDKIVFACDNQIATFYLTCIKVFFTNLKHSTISKSNSFYNKKNKLLNENDLNKAKNLYEKKKEISSHTKLAKAIDDIFSMQK